jgi:hypothetical protein
MKTTAALLLLFSVGTLTGRAEDPKAEHQPTLQSQPRTPPKKQSQETGSDFLYRPLRPKGMILGRIVAQVTHRMAHQPAIVPFGSDTTWLLS